MTFAAERQFGRPTTELIGVSVGYLAVARNELRRVQMTLELAA